MIQIILTSLVKRPPPVSLRDPQKKHLNKIKEQQQEREDVAVFFHDCLKEIDIPEQDKIEISSMYNSDVVEYAIAFTKHPKTKIKSTFQQCIKWACKNKPDLPVDDEKREDENRNYAKKLAKELKNNPLSLFNSLNSYVELSYEGCQKNPDCIEYSETQFKNLLDEKLRKHKYQRKDGKPI